MLSDVLEIHTGVMIRFSSRSTKMISLKNMYLTFFFPCFWTSPCFFDLSKVVWDFGQTFFLCGWDEKSTKQNIEENKRSWRIISSWWQETRYNLLVCSCMQHRCLFCLSITQKSKQLSVLSVAFQTSPKQKTATIVFVHNPLGQLLGNSNALL